MVFEGLVSDLLTKYLGDFVKNLNKDQLKIGIFGGDVVLNNLELKEDALQALNLPVQVNRGFLGRLELKVPWKNLKSQPVVVRLDRIFLLVGPQTVSFSYDEDAEAKKAKEAKGKQLESYELMKSLKAQPGDTKGDNSFTARLTTKIVDNLQIHISKIHVRYEDTMKGKPFAFGITIDHLSAQSTNDLWQAAFIETAQIVHKLAKLGDLSVYLDTTTTSLASVTTAAQMSEVFQSLIPSSSSPFTRNNEYFAPDGKTPLHQFILRPLSAELKVKLNKSETPDMNIPKAVLEAVFQEMALSISETQFHAVLQLLQLANGYARDIKWLKYRPNVSVKTSPRAWWQYAGNVLLEDIHARRMRRSWAYMFQRRKDRMQYIGLYKRKQGVKWLPQLNKEEQATLQQLDEKLSFEDVVYFRSLADAELKKESLNAERRAEYEKSLQKNKKGIFGSWFGPKQTKEEEEQQRKALEAAPTIELSSEQREEIYRTIGYEDVVADIQEPKDYVKIWMKLQLEKLSFKLVGDVGPSVQAILDGSFEDIGVTVAQRPDSMKVEGGIRSFGVRDPWTPRTRFPMIITPSQGKPAESTQFCRLAFESNPLDGHADFAVSLRMNPLDVVVNRRHLERIAAFFSTQHDVDLAGISNMANDAYLNWRESTRLQLQEALEQHKTMDLFVDVRAPTVILPQDVERKEGSLLVVDLGNLNIKSDIKPKAKRGGVAAIADVSENNDDLYDHLVMSLTSIKVLLADETGPSWKDPVAQRDRNMQLVEDLNINLLLKNSIQPENLILPKLVISGTMPSVRLNFSDAKYKQVMALVDTLTVPAEGARPAAPPAAQLPAPASAVVTPTGAAGGEVMSMMNEIANAEAAMAQREKGAKNPEFQTLLLNHKLTKVTFKIGTISVALNKSMTATTEKPLARLNIVGLTGEFVQRTFDMRASFELQKIEIEDELEKAPQYKYLASSNPYGAFAVMQQEQAAGDALIQFGFVQTQRNSPEYKKEDMSVDFVFNSFFVAVNQPTVKALLEFAMNLAPPNPAPIPAIAPPPTPAILATPATSSLATSITANAPPAQSAGAAAASAIVPNRMVRKAKTSDIVQMRINARLQTLGMVLNQGGSTLAQFSINNIGVSLKRRLGMMDIEGSLASIQMIDCTVPPDSPYCKVMSPVDQGVSMITFAYQTAEEAVLGEDYPGWDSSVSLQMRSVRIIALYGFVIQIERYFLGSGMLDPVMNPNTTAALPPAVASPRSPRSPRDREAGEPDVTLAPPAAPAGKMKLDIHLASPIIIIPEGPKSRNVVVAELGEIKLVNAFEESTPDGPGPVRTRERMLVTLSDMHIRSQRPETFQILQKVEVAVQLDRVLNIPQGENAQMRVSVKISNVDFCLTEDEYVFLWGISNAVTKQLAEVTPAQPPALPPPAAVHAPASTDVVVAGAGAKSIKPITYLGETVTVVQLELPTVRFEIRRHAGLLPEDPVASFEIHQIQLEMQMSNLNYMDMRVTLHTIELLDRRQNTGSVFPQLMAHRTATLNTDDATPNKARPPQLGMTYVRDNTVGDQAIKVDIDHPRIFLSPSAIFAIRDFFMVIFVDDPATAAAATKAGAAPTTPSKLVDRRVVALSETAPGSAPTNPSSPTPVHVHAAPPPEVAASPSSPQTAVATSNTGAPAVVVPVGPNTTGPTLVVDVTVTSPDILLVEDETNTDSRAVVVKCSVDMRYVMHPSGAYDIELETKKLKMFIYKPNTSESSGDQGIRAIPILNPVDVHVLMAAMSGPVPAMAIKCKMQPAELFFSYQDYKLIMTIVEALKLAQQPPPNTDTPSTSLTSSTSSTSSSMGSSAGSLGSTTTLTPPTDVAIVVAAVPVEVINREQLTYECSSFHITLINDLHGRNTPFAEIRTSDLKASVRGWSSSLQVSSSMVLTMDYFNNAIMVYEPLIEYWSFTAEVISGVDPQMEVKLHSDEILNINVTHAFVDALANTYSILREDFQHDSKVHHHHKRAIMDDTSSTMSGSESPPMHTPPDSPSAFRNSTSSLHSAASSSSLSDSQTITPVVFSKKFRPYWFNNETGLPVEYFIQIHESEESATKDATSKFDDTPVVSRRPSLHLVSSPSGEKKGVSRFGGPCVTVGAGKRDFIDLKGTAHSSRANFRQFQVHGVLLAVRFIEKVATGDRPFAHDIPIDKVGSHFCELSVPGAPSPKPLKLVAEVAWNPDGSKSVTLRSLLVVENHLTVPADVRVELLASKQAVILTPSIEPGQSRAIPILYANDPETRLSARPAPSVSGSGTDELYAWSREADAIKVEKLSSWPARHSLVCPASAPAGPSSVPHPEFFRMAVNVKSLPDSKEQRVIGLYPPVTLENLLPYPIRVGLVDASTSLPTHAQPVHTHATCTIASGDSVSLYNTDPSRNLTIALSGLPGFQETQHTLISGEDPQKGTRYVRKLQIRDTTSKRTLTLSVDPTEPVEGSRIISLFCPYWLVNNSQLVLHYRAPTEKNEDAVGVVNSNDKTNIGFPYLHSEDKLLLRVGHGTGHNDALSGWSKAFPLTTVGATGALEIPEINKRCLYGLKAHIALASGKFQRTKVVTFTPRFVLVNHMTVPLRVKQINRDASNKQKEEAQHNDNPSSAEKKEKKPAFGGLFQSKKDKEKEKEKERERAAVVHERSSSVNSLSGSKGGPEDVLTIMPGDSQPYHYQYFKTNKKKKMKAQRGTDDNWTWSGGFVIDAVGEFSIKMRQQSNSPDVYIARVEISDTSASTFVVFRDEDPAMPPFEIQNDTPLQLRFKQKLSKQVDTLPSKKHVHYSLDEPSKPPLLLVDIEGDKETRPFNLNKIKTHKPLKVGGQTIYSFLWVNGPTRILCFTLDKSRYQRRLTMVDEDKREGEVVLFKMSISLSGVGLSIVDDQPQELLYLSVTGIELQTSNTTHDDTIECKIGDLQIDNQMYSTEFPVLLHSVKKDPNQPFMHVSMIKSRADKTIDYYQYFSVLFQEMSCNVEDALLTSVMRLYQNLGPAIAKLTAADVANADAVAVDLPYTTLDLTPPPSGTTGRMVYFKLLVLNPIKLNITFSLTQDGFLSSGPGKAKPPYVVPLEAIGVTVAKLDNAPIRLNALMLEHPFASWTSLTNKITQHYTRQALTEVYKLLGSADMLGNPVGLFNNLGTGVVDFFFEPAQGIVKSPQEFGKGLAKGTSSLVRNTFYGTFNTVSKITGTLGKGIATLSLDDSYLAERHNAERKKPKHIGEGLVMGAQSLGKGIFDGVTGIVRKPVEGAMKDGIEGFGKGLAQGLIGVAVKPVAGVLDFTTRTTEGIRNTTQLQQTRYRVRPPRSFAAGGALKEYAREESEGHMLLQQVNKGKYSRETYVFHKLVVKGHVTLLTNKRVLSARSKESIIFNSMDWQVKYMYIKSMDLAKEGIILHLDPPQVVNVLEPPKKILPIKIDDEGIAMQIFTKLAACIKLWKKEGEAALAKANTGSSLAIQGPSSHKK